MLESFCIAVALVFETGFGISALNVDGMVVSSSAMDDAMDFVHVNKFLSTRDDALPNNIQPVNWTELEYASIVPQLVDGKWYMVSVCGSRAYSVSDHENVCITLAHQTPCGFVGKVAVPSM